MQDLGRSSTRRRRLIKTVSLGAFLLLAAWIARPRFDPRMVGTWSDGEFRMVIRDDGMADCFYGQARTGSGWMGTYAHMGPFKIRLSGNRFKLVRFTYQTDTLDGLRRYLRAVFNREPTESVEFSGVVCGFGENVMALDVWGRPSGARSIGEINHSVCVYHRIKDAPFNTGPNFATDGLSSR